VWTNHTTQRTSPTAAQSTIGLPQQPPTQQIPYAASPHGGQAGSSGGGQYGPQDGPGPLGGQDGGQQPYGGQPHGGQQPYEGQPYGNQPSYGQPGYPSAPPAYAPTPQGYGSVLGVKATPDGVPLASYGQRVGAWLLDLLIVAVITGILASYWISQLVSWYVNWINDLIAQTNAGGQPTFDQADLATQITGFIWPITLIGFLVTVFYQVAFLTTKGATPGKMALGIAVRLRARPGNLSVADALRRQLIYIGTTLLGLVPVVGFLSGFIQVACGCWTCSRSPSMPPGSP
jgi:uncharacterized RDD family membrane protein YckC